MADADSFDQPTPPLEPEPNSGELPESQVTINFELTPGTRLKVTLDARAPDGTLIEQRNLTLENPSAIPINVVQEPIQVQKEPATNSVHAGISAVWPLILLAGVILVYLATRLIGLEHFPIYFFTDEAIQTVTASDLIRDDFRNEFGEFLPAYFKNGGQYNLSLSVYLQVLPTLIFGKSVFVTRAVSVLISLLAVISVGLSLRTAFQSRSAWAGAMFLALTPAWFLHSRTAFETVLGVSFYAAFLYCYFRYRQGKTSFLYAGAGCAAAMFYSYSAGQIVLAATILLLFISDFRYHWQQRKHLLRGLVLAGILALPYVQFQLNHPGETVRHLQILDSYWTQEIALREKLLRFLQEYFRGLNPIYWYNPESDGLTRHIMKGYGYLWLPGLPFAAIGLLTAVKKSRHSAYRTVLAAVLAAPTGAAVVSVGITRLLFMVVPVALLGGIGFEVSVEWLSKKFKAQNTRSRVFTGVSLAAFAAGTLLSIAMLRDALVNGPTWFDDYGLGGMQYGGQKFFDDLRFYLDENPTARITLSPSWANGTDVIARFFFNDPLPFAMGSIESYLQQYIPINPDEVFVLLPEELQQATESGKFKSVDILRTLDYPNGQPGFFYTRLVYRDDVDEIFAAEHAERQKLVKERIPLAGGLAAEVSHSYLDMGKIEEAFDGNLNNLVRTYEANPFKINLTFDSPLVMEGLRLRIGGVPTLVTALVYVDGEALPRHFSAESGENPAPQMLEIDFMQKRQVTALQIEILNIRDQEPAHVHLWEVQFR